jgi:hypothetical protein
VSHFTTVLSILGHSPPFSQLGTKLCNLFFICVEYTARAACYAIIPPAHIIWDITFAPWAIMFHPTTSFVRQLMHAPIPCPLIVDICIYRVIPTSVYHLHTSSIALRNGLTPYKCTHLNSLRVTHISTWTVMVSQLYIIFVLHPPFRVSSFFLLLHFGAFGMLRQLLTGS